MSTIQRIKAPASAFFKKLKTIGVKVGTVAAYIIAAPVRLPTIITTIASYLGLAGNVAAIVGSKEAAEDMDNKKEQ